MDNLKNIANKIIANNGCNIDKNLNLKDIKSGYVVSLAKYEKTIDLNNLKDLNNADKLKELYNAFTEKINQLDEFKKDNHKANAFIGAWYNNSKLYIDISCNIQNLYNAINFGKKQSQYAIYDVKNQKDIELVTDTFIIYQYDKIKNDFIYKKECLNYKQVKDILNISKNQFYNILVNTIDNFDISKLYLNKFAIVKDKAFYRDLA